MAGLFDGLVKGIVNLAPQDNPDVKVFNAQSELKELAEQETKLFAALGKKVYEEGGKEAYPDITAQLDALNIKRDELNASIKSAQAEKEAAEKAEEAANGVVCENCGEVNAEGCKFCSSCGNKLPEAVKKRFCTACGAEVEDGKKFCSGCGNPMQ